MAQSEQVNELAAALAKAQGKIRGAQKDGNNPHFKSKYASLDSVWDACREPLSTYGLSVVQSVQRGILRTVLLHASGQWIDGEIEIPAGKNVQELGSAITYLRRYTLSALVGIAPTDDDDGNASSAGYREPERTSNKPSAGSQERPAQEARARPMPWENPQDPPETAKLRKRLHDLVGEFYDVYQDLPQAAAKVGLTDAEKIPGFPPDKLQQTIEAILAEGKARAGKRSAQ